jgi:hypothetical protein
MIPLTAMQLVRSTMSEVYRSALLVAFVLPPVASRTFGAPRSALFDQRAVAIVKAREALTKGSTEGFEVWFGKRLLQHKIALRALWDASRPDDQ